MPVLMYDSEAMIWKERSSIRAVHSETMIKKERSSIMDVQMDNLRSLLGIRRMDKVPNAWITVLCGMMKINEGVL